MPGAGDGGKGGARAVFPAIILWKPIPTPSMTPKSTAQPIPEVRAAFLPPLIANEPPVKNPAMTAAC